MYLNKISKYVYDINTETKPNRMIKRALPILFLSTSAVKYIENVKGTILSILYLRGHINIFQSFRTDLDYVREIVSRNDIKC